MVQELKAGVIFVKNIYIYIYIYEAGVIFQYGLTGQFNKSLLLKKETTILSLEKYRMEIDWIYIYNAE